MSTALQQRIVVLDLASDVLQKLRSRLYPCNQQVIPSPRAGDIEEVPLRLVDVLQVSVVRDGFDPRLQRHDLVITRHDRNRLELESLAQVHRPEGNVVS